MALDDEIRTFLDQLKEQQAIPTYEMSPQAARQARLEALHATEEVIPKRSVQSVLNLTVPGEDGEVPIRVYRPSLSKPRGALVYYHGGGWVLGNLDTVDDTCRALCDQAGYVVVSVDYRLAPEHRFPAALEDSYLALQWVIEHALELDIAREKIVVGGDSAGGNIATVMALKAFEEGKNLLGQLLVYPITNYSFETASYEENASGYNLEKRGMEWFWDHYLRHPDDGRNPYASPLLAEDLSGLPQTFVLTAQYDPLRDEGIAYVKRLREAGVPLQHVHENTMIHGFFTNYWGGKRREAALHYAADCLQRWASDDES
ncbi:alpha/beta hydrolase [Alicyclobacillus ferrooxydans]|uniref:Alpha/beta hydrolase fold-3 domain-containing protein n=1 Tax=Alicyclobacillus ferrooxydans TaxID=471514 RepID=A0A0P9CVW9_9BACL|nr:alpha/beta hydrolase [Alicyclobacillus ferrooxydans]KPV40798.1 hypothetical protein AN477_21015 [Alicyclobacillus ferrooxydans]